MKACPICKSIVDEEFECPVCLTTLTYEPNCAGDREEYTVNKFFIRYMTRQCWFSVFCTVVVTVLAFFIDSALWVSSVMAWAAAACSVLMGIFQRYLIKKYQWKYTADYAGYHVVGAKYGLSCAAVLAAALMTIGSVA